MSTSTTPTRGIGQLSAADGPQSVAVPQRRATTPGARHFFRHYGEMFIAMMIGMMVLGMVDRGILSAVGTSVGHVRDSAPEVFALVMALNMTIGMTVWMRYRGHSWAMCTEMAVAMFAPAILAIVLFRAGVVDGPGAGGVLMGAMVPAMLAVMLLRRTEYSQPVHKHAQMTVAQTGNPRR